MKKKKQAGFVERQLHAGNRGSDKIWHTDSEGKYWSGLWHHRTPQELYRESLSVIADLLQNHPELSRG